MPPRRPPRKPSRARRPSRADRSAVERALRELLEGLGYELEGDLAGAPARAAELWIDRLIAGEHRDLGRIIQEGRRAETSSAPVCVTGMGVHMVCPHHLTVSFGHAHVAYVPGGHIVGFGTLARLVEAATARLVLQERATRDIARALVEHLGARAAAVAIQAIHPCHNVLHARSHDAQALTWASEGDPAQTPALHQMIMSGLDPTRRLR